MMRFGPLAEVTQQIARSGVLGVMLRGMVTNCAGDDGLPPDHWFWKREQSGGIFIEHGVHFFDLVRSWLGEGRAKAAQQLQRPGTERVDQVLCEVYYPPQSTVNFYHGFHQPHHLDRQRVTLIFERGELIMHGWVADTLELQAVLSQTDVEKLCDLLPEGTKLETVRRLEGKERVGSRRTQHELVDQVIRATWRDPADKQTVYGQSLQALMLDFIHSIQEPAYLPRVTVEDGLAALELAVEADRLAREAPDE
jgi:predicted dehydrogenase